MLQTEDSRIDSIAIKPARRPSKTFLPVDIVTDEELKPIKHIIGTVSLGHVELFAQQMANGYGFGNDSGQVMFSGDPGIEPEIEPFEGVMFMDFFEDQVVMSRDAFWRFMDRLFTTLIEIANERKLKILDEPRWPVFLEHAARIKQLAGETS